MFFLNAAADVCQNENLLLFFYTGTRLMEEQSKTVVQTSRESPNSEVRRVRKGGNTN